MRRTILLTTALLSTPLCRKRATKSDTMESGKGNTAYFGMIRLVEILRGWAIPIHGRCDWRCSLDGLRSFILLLVLRSRKGTLEVRCRSHRNSKAESNDGDAGPHLDRQILAGKKKESRE